MAWCCQATSHCLSQCWLLIDEVLCDSPDNDFTRQAQDTNTWIELESYTFKISIKSPSLSPRGQWVKIIRHGTQGPVYPSYQYHGSWCLGLSGCSNYIFILALIHGFSRLDKDNCKTRWETEFWNLVCLILEIWQHYIFGYIRNMLLASFQQIPLTSFLWWLCLQWM